jgi:hypothetical protein
MSIVTDARFDDLAAGRGPWSRVNARDAASRIRHARSACEFSELPDDTTVRFGIDTPHIVITNRGRCNVQLSTWDALRPFANVRAQQEARRPNPAGEIAAMTACPPSRDRH